MHQNPYGADLDGREPLDALATTPQEIRAIVERWPQAQFEKTYAPGKWSARRLLVHLAQTELALGTRVRFALSTPGYTAQSFDQDVWLPLDEQVDAGTALDVYTTLRRMNMAMWRALAPGPLNNPFVHPDFGEVTPLWVAAQMAGHDIHHLKHFQQIAAAPV